MTDLAQNEVITNKKGDHYRFISLENSEAEAEKVCNQLLDSGFQAATFQREDNKLWEVFQKFSPAEECMFLLKEKCDGCKAKDTEDCHAKSCKNKFQMEDILWKESRGFHTLVQHDLKKLRKGVKVE